MKRVKCILILVLISLSILVKAQESFNELSINTIVKPYRLEIGYYTTTVLVFPSPVLIGDRGFNEIIATKEKELANVLKIKAAKKNFNPTDLHVFTADGKIYPFEIIFSEHPSEFTFDLSKLNQTDSGTLKDASLIFSGNKISDTQLQNELSRINTSKSFFGKSFRKYEMRLRLKTIHVCGNRMYFGLELSNKSNLSYDMDFIRTYVQDKKRVKRSSFQEKEIIPFYLDHLKIIPGGTKLNLVIAVPKFTLSDDKEFRIELFEKNGGRNLSLEIKNRQLLSAKNM